MSAVPLTRPAMVPVTVAGTSRSVAWATLLLGSRSATRFGSPPTVAGTTSDRPASAGLPARAREIPPKQHGLG